MDWEHPRHRLLKPVLPESTVLHHGVDMAMPPFKRKKVMAVGLILSCFFLGARALSTFEETSNSKKKSTFLAWETPIFGPWAHFTYYAVRHASIQMLNLVGLNFCKCFAQSIPQFLCAKHLPFNPNPASHWRISLASNWCNPSTV